MHPPDALRSPSLIALLRDDFVYALRRAIKEGDLSASGGCNYCGLRALVGEGRERVISVPRTVAQQREVVVTKEVPHIYEEEYSELPW